MTDKAPVRKLITALRSPLPRGFEWDFRYPPTCACGLALRKGINVAWMQPFSAWETDGIVPLYGVAARDVTPTMVADALEALVGQSV